MEYEVQQIAKDTWMIRSPMVQMFLVQGTEKAMLIDTGAGIGDLKAQVEKLTDKPLIVVNTHGHMDHAGGNFQFPQVWMHEADFEISDTMCTMPVREDYVRSRMALFAPDKTDEALAALQPCAPYERLALTEGQIFDLGDRPFEVIFSPGHTAGSVCFLDKKYKRMFTGDTVNNGMLLQKSYRCTPLSVYVATLDKLMARGAEYHQIVRCHGQPFGSHDDLRVLRDMVQGIVEGRNVCTHFVNPMRDCWNYSFGNYTISCDGPDSEL